MKALQAAKTVARDVYAWPGGYPLFVITTDGGALCPACVKSEWRHIVSASLSNDTRSGWHPAGAEINWEDQNLICDHCSGTIQSAYGND